MFCGKCGNKNEEGMKFCGSCGAPVGETTATPKSMNAKEIVVGFVKLNASDEDNAIVTVADKVIKANFIFKVASVLLVVAFFLPMFSIQVRMLGISAGQSINGWTAAFGLEGAGGSFMAIFLLLIPIAIFVLFQFKTQLETKIAFVKGKLFTLSTVGFCLGFVVLLFVRSSANSIWRGNIGNSAGFWLTLLFYLIAGVVSVGCLLSARGANIKIGASSASSQPVKTPAIVGLPIQMMAIPMGASVLLLIAFFLNWITIDISDVFGIGSIFGGLGIDMPGLDIPNITMSGWNTISGNAEEGFEAMGISWGFLLIPIAQLALYGLQKVIILDNMKLLIISAVLFVVGIILLPVFAFQIEDAYNGMGSLGLGFIISAIVYLLAALATGFFFIQSRKKQTTGG